MASALSLMLLANFTYNAGYTPPNDTPIPAPIVVPTTTARIDDDRTSMMQLARDYNYVYTPEIGAHKVHTEATNWHRARKICEEEMGYLAIINSVAEAKVLKDLFQASKSRISGTNNFAYNFLGFHGLYEEGEFVTIHGQSLSDAGYEVWSDKEPNNLNDDEYCGSMDDNGKLNDISCTDPYAFICELSKV